MYWCCSDFHSPSALESLSIVPPYWRVASCLACQNSSTWHSDSTSSKYNKNRHTPYNSYSESIVRWHGSLCQPRIFPLQIVQSHADTNYPTHSACEEGKEANPALDTRVCHSQLAPILHFHSFPYWHDFDSTWFQSYVGMCQCVHWSQRASWRMVH